MCGSILLGLGFDGVSERAFGQCGNTWTCGFSEIDGEVYAMVTWDPDGEGPDGPLLVVGGLFQSVGPGIPANNVAAWNGSEWASLGIGTSYYINALVVHEGSLIAGGDFLTAGGQSVNNVARWDGSTWHPLEGPGIGVEGTVSTLYSVGTDLIAGGTFTTAGGLPAHHIARWDGHSWQAYGEGLPGTVSACIEFGDQVYASGITGGVAAWNGSTWNVLGGVGLDGQVESLAVFQGMLIAGGNFNRRGIVSQRVAMWNGDAWLPMASGLNGPVFALAVFQGSLIAAGSFVATGDGSRPLSNIARWDGEDWRGLGAGVSGNEQLDPPPYLYSLVTFNDELIVGGEQFSHAGVVSARGLARWGVPSPGDFNCDGDVTSDDFFSFITCFFGGSCPANRTGDVNDDGEVTSQDFFDFLAAFFTGC